MRNYLFFYFFNLNGMRGLFGRRELREYLQFCSDGRFLQSHSASIGDVIVPGREHSVTEVGFDDVAVPPITGGTSASNAGEDEHGKAE